MKFPRKGSVAPSVIRRQEALRIPTEIGPAIRALQARGALTPKQIADGLNAMGIQAIRGRWTAVHVVRVLARMRATRVTQKPQ
jgi:hypothetical protein